MRGHQAQPCQTPVCTANVSQPPSLCPAPLHPPPPPAHCEGRQTSCSVPGQGYCLVLSVCPAHSSLSPSPGMGGLSHLCGRVFCRHAGRGSQASVPAWATRASFLYFCPHPAAATAPQDASSGAGVDSLRLPSPRFSPWHHHQQEMSSAPVKTTTSKLLLVSKGRDFIFILLYSGRRMFEPTRAMCEFMLTHLLCSESAEVFLFRFWLLFLGRSEEDRKTHENLLARLKSELRWCVSV